MPNQLLLQHCHKTKGQKSDHLAAAEGAKVALTVDTYCLDLPEVLQSCVGDFADLPALAALRQEHGFLLAIDEAHATLVCGERYFMWLCALLC